MLHDYFVALNSIGHFAFLESPCFHKKSLLAHFLSFWPPSRNLLGGLISLWLPLEVMMFLCVPVLASFLFPLYIGPWMSLIYAHSFICSLSVGDFHWHPQYKTLFWVSDLYIQIFTWMFHSQFYINIAETKAAFFYPSIILFFLLGFLS